MSHTLYHGDCLEVLAGLADNSVDSMAADPPSGINFMSKDWDSDKGGRDKWIAWLSGIMKECYRVLKPGGHAFVWALPRTSHWTGMALELAGFEVRDCVSSLYDSGRDVTAFLETLSAEQCNMLEIILANGDDNFNVMQHVFGSGFPKSANIGKMIDQKLGMVREVVGRDKNWGASKLSQGKNGYGDYEGAWSITAPASAEAKQHDGWGSALKPAAEYWWLVRKPLSEPTIAANVLKWGTGGLNIDGTRVTGEGWYRSEKGTPDMKTGECYGNRKRIALEQSPLGRFPSNIIIDGSDPVEAEFAKAGVRSSGASSQRAICSKSHFSETKKQWQQETEYSQSTGSASRFFYCAKPSSRERNEGLDGFEEKQQRTTYDKSVRDSHGEDSGYARKNIHPTVKSLELMKYLITMITPKNGTVLDCFMGSGTTGVAALKNGFSFIGIEKERPYFEIAEARIRHAACGQAGEIIAPEPLPQPKPKLQLAMF